MRHALSILLLVVFGLGPLAPTLEAGDARLPACCRSHGAHHCAMSAALMARMLRAESQSPGFSAPSTCPLYRGILDQASATEQALLAAPAAAPVPTTHAAVVLAYRPAPRTAQRALRVPRGPPAL